MLDPTRATLRPVSQLAEMVLLACSLFSCCQLGSTSEGFGNGVLHRGGPASADLPYSSRRTRTTLWIDEGEPQHMGATRTGLVKEQGQSLSLYSASPRGSVPPAAGMTAGQDTTAYEHYPRLVWRAYDSFLCSNQFGGGPELVHTMVLQRLSGARRSRSMTDCPNSGTHRDT